MSTDTSLDSAALTDLRTAIAGKVITPDDEEYDAARALWNGRIDRFPAVVDLSGLTGVDLDARRTCYGVT